MTSDKLSQSYKKKAGDRIKALEFLESIGAHSDVVREGQECVELILKGFLRNLGVEIPKIHDVSRVLVEHTSKLPKDVAECLPKICSISKNLRRDRELSFYGTEDWIPTEEYGEEDSKRVIEEVKFVFSIFSKHL